MSPRLHGFTGRDPTLLPWRPDEGLNRPPERSDVMPDSDSFPVHRYFILI